MDSARGGRGVTKGLDLQRFFSAFPGGGAGVGLLLLRLAVGAAAGVQATALLGTGGSAIGASVIAAVTLSASLLVCAGLIARVSGPVAGLGALWIAGFAASAGLAATPLDPPAASLVLVDGAALALLGPGALSADAYLFGRREIVIPEL